MLRILQLIAPLDDRAALLAQNMCLQYVLCAVPTLPKGSCTEKGTDSIHLTHSPKEPILCLSHIHIPPILIIPSYLYIYRIQLPYFPRTPQQWHE